MKHFFRMNDVDQPWFKTSKNLGEDVSVVKDRAYTREEIRQILAKAVEKEMKNINNSSQKYVHPLLPEDDAYKDAEESINLLCKIIDSLSS